MPPMSMPPGAAPADPEPPPSSPPIRSPRPPPPSGGRALRGSLALLLVRDQAHDDRREDRQQLAEVDAGGLRLLGQPLCDGLLLPAEDVAEDLLAVVGAQRVQIDLAAGDLATVGAERLLDRRRALRRLRVALKPAQDRRTALFDGPSRFARLHAELRGDVIDRKCLENLVQSSHHEPLVVAGLVARCRQPRLSLMRAADVQSEITQVLVTEEQILAKLEEIAAQVAHDYEGKELLLVGVLKGAIMVMADFSRALPTLVPIDWMAVSSYGAGTQSSGVVQIRKDLDTDLHGKHVLIVEDIIDSGLTLSWLLKNFASRGAASVEVFALLRKPDAAKVHVECRYVGFDIPSEFVVGYGLDYAEKYRNLRDVAILAPHVYA